jgi:lipoate-protein ligase A
VATSSAWQVERVRGSASAFHARVPTGRRREAWWLDVDRPALVLGSAQPDATVDREACAAAGVEVVRRRSGGGAVLLVPGSCVWLDVVVPRSDRLWDDDIGRAMWWLGEVWAAALAGLGVDGVAVHRGPLRHTPWSRLVCFDSLGAGEVTVGARKAVGISQRRTREWARLQSSAYLAPLDPGGPLVELLAPPRPAAAQLQPPALLPLTAAEVDAAVTAALAAR